MATQLPGRAAAAAAGPDECIHEILAASCFWCSPRPGVEDIYDDDNPGARAPARRTGWIQASSFGACGGCGVDIYPGDTVKWVGRARHCEDCADA